MRVTAIAGLFACGVVFISSNSSVSAEGLKLLNTSAGQRQFGTTVLDKVEPPTLVASASPQPVPAAPGPKIHVVGENETLSSIALQHQTTWNRVFNKNEQIAHPDVIKVGDKLTIPLPEEQLNDRPLPAPPVPPLPTQGVKNVNSNGAPRASMARGASSGNTYTPGYCTWYAKNMRPDLPNNLGNADTWVSRAAAQGLPTGSVPRAGAIGQQGMHVVYVQQVNPDGTVTISEMNYNGLYVVSTRTVAASSFMYIY